jgi:hypothetical protein
MYLLEYMPSSIPDSKLLEIQFFIISWKKISMNLNVIKVLRVFCSIWWFWDILLNFELLGLF